MVMVAFTKFFRCWMKELSVLCTLKVIKLAIMSTNYQSTSRRKFFRKTIAAAFGASLGTPLMASTRFRENYEGNKEGIVITKLETFKVKPRFLFLRVHTDQGIVGLGEPITEGRADTCAEAVKEISPYLVGKDPRRVMHHWQAIYRHTFYRGGPILTSALSGIEQALWDIKGQALGVPVYELLGVSHP